MALRYGYFDSDIIGIDEEGMPIFDRAETSDLFALLFSSLVSDGVLALPSTCFQVIAAGNGLNLNVQPGFGMVKGHFAFNDEVLSLDIGTAPQKYNRIDRVILRCNYLERMVEIVLKTGEEAANPIPPELIRPSAGDYYELCLANIRLSAGQTLITQSSITDTRPDSSVCGYITQLIDHLDTEVFMQQFYAWYEEFVYHAENDYSKNMQYYMTLCQRIVDRMTAFENTSEIDFTEWFEKIRGQLSEDAAGKLQNQLNELREWRFIDGYLRVPYGGAGIDDGYLIINDFQGGN